MVLGAPGGGREESGGRQQQRQRFVVSSLDVEKRRCLVKCQTTCSRVLHVPGPPRALPHTTLYLIHSASQHTLTLVVNDNVVARIL